MLGDCNGVVYGGVDNFLDFLAPKVNGSSLPLLKLLPFTVEVLLLFVLVLLIGVIFNGGRLNVFEAIE